MAETEWDDPALPLRARRNREVFARYGLAMHNAQCLEKQLALMLTLSTPTFFTQNPKERDFLFDKALSEPFGKIWNKLRTVVPFDKNLIDQISKARTIRNHLAHNYFWEHAADLLSEEGQEKMIFELTATAERFKNLDDRLTKIIDAYSQQIGITEKMIATEIEKLKKSDSA